ncbi:MAG: Dihydrofolate reductase [Bacteroidota bacterium]
MKIKFQKVIKILVACDEKRVIGKNNTLIWHLPADLKRFKELTTGNVIIMGRKTFDSIGRPLPNRLNIVITRQTNYQQEGVIIVHSLEEAILKAKSLHRGDIYIVGGAEIYQMAMKLADEIEVTLLHDIFDGDAFFPEIDPTIWKEISSERGVTDEKNPYQYSFKKYKKVSK